MVKLSKLRSNQDTITGQWHEYVPGVTVCVAKWGNPRHKAAIERIALDRVESGRPLQEEEVNADERRAAAEGLITGWKGLENEDGTEMKFSPEKAVEVFMNNEYWEFFTFIKSKAMVGYRAPKVIEGN